MEDGWNYSAKAISAALLFDVLGLVLEAGRKPFCNDPAPEVNVLAYTITTVILEYMWILLILYILYLHEEHVASVFIIKHGIIVSVILGMAQGIPGGTHRLLR